MSARRQQILGMALVFAVALAARWGHLAGLRASWTDTALFDLPRGDAIHHWNEALDIRSGNLFLSDRMLWKGPGYSYFLAILMTVFGPSVATLRWMLAALGAVNCVGLYWLARRVLPWRWAVLTGLLAAVHGVLVMFDGELLFPTLLIALNLPVLAILGRPSATRGRLAWAGVCAGCAALVHPVYLLPAASVLAWKARRQRREAFVFGLAVAVTVLPVTAQNALQRGQLELISWSGGINLYVANQPGFDQTSGQSTPAWGRVLATTEAAGWSRESQRDRAYYRLFVEQIARAPGKAATIFLQKIRLLFSPVEIANNVRVYEFVDQSPVLAVLMGHRGPLWWPFGLWLPAALLGWLAAWTPREGRRHPLHGALTWWMAGLALSIVLSFNTARYRVPLVFFGTLYAATWLHHVWRAGSARRRAAWIGGFAILVVGIAENAVPQKTLPAPSSWSEARHLEAVATVADAALAYERALAGDPRNPGLRLSVSNFYGRHGLPRRQAEILLQTLELPDLEPDHEALIHEGLARAYLGTLDIERSREHARLAMLVNADDCVWRGWPYFAMDLVPTTDCKLRLLAAEIELAGGDLVTAGSLVETAVRECPRSPDTRREAGRIAAEIQRRGRGSASETRH